MIRIIRPKGPTYTGKAVVTIGNTRWFFVSQFHLPIPVAVETEMEPVPTYPKGGLRPVK